MSYNKPLQINFNGYEIMEIHKAIAEMTLDLMQEGVIVTYLNDEQDTPILPCSVHSLDSLPCLSHLQYKLDISAQKDALIPSMIVIKLRAQIKDAYPWPVRVFHALVHEYSHVRTFSKVDRIDNRLEVDLEDCEFKCVVYMRDYLIQRFDSKLAEKIWLYTKIYLCCIRDSHYNKSAVWTMNLHDFEE